MNVQFKKNYYLGFFFSLLTLLILVLFFSLLIVDHYQHLEVKTAETRYQSYITADELRQSSDDLTKMVRMYVITGKKEYRDYFNEILAIRNGQAPRPLNYQQIYWDLVLHQQRPRPATEPKALRQIMLEQGFTAGELNLLLEAKTQSNALTAREIRAMNAVEGKYDDGSGKYTLRGPPNYTLAKDLVFNDDYMETKANIMAPLQKFFDAIHARTAKQYESAVKKTQFVIVFSIILTILSSIIMVISIIKAIQAMSKMSKDNETLLLNILPLPVIDRLKKGEQTIADEYPEVSVLFADIVGFTAMTKQLGPQKIVTILNRLFTEYDNLTEKFGVEKIKTIGDNYMAVAGIPIPAIDHAERLADFALTLKQKMIEFNEINKTELQIRIGMNSGAIIAGVIGHKKFIYDLWGDVVNIASRIESSSLPGEIQITEKTASLLQEKFIIVPRDEIIEVKGHIKLQTYFLKGRK